MSMPNNVQVLATSVEQAEQFMAGADEIGLNVTDAKIWTGIVPPNSYFYLNDFVRMSTPEFFFLRKCNQLPTNEAIALGNELCGYYATSKTCTDFPSWYWESILEPRTTKTKLANYLRPVSETHEAKRALAILESVIDGKEMP